MAREVISRDALEKIINEHLQCQPECKSLSPIGVAVDVTRAQGANWVMLGYKLLGDVHNMDACHAATAPYIQTLQDQYDIEA